MFFKTGLLGEGAGLRICNCRFIKERRLPVFHRGACFLGGGFCAQQMSAAQKKVSALAQLIIQTRLRVADCPDKEKFKKAAKQITFLMICMPLVRAPVGKTLAYALSSIHRRLRWLEDVTLYSSQQLARCCKREGPRRWADRRKEKRKKNNPGQRSFSFSAFKTSEAMHYSPRKTRNTPRHESQRAN